MHTATGRAQGRTPGRRIQGAARAPAGAAHGGTGRRHRASLLLVAAVLLGGCLPTGHFQYVDSAGTREEALQAARDRASAQGLQRLDPGRRHRPRPGLPRDGERWGEPARSKPGQSHAPPPGAAEAGTEVWLRAERRAAGTRVELASRSRRLLERLAPAQAPFVTYQATQGPPPLRVRYDVNVQVGGEKMAGHKLHSRVDLQGRLGLNLFRVGRLQQTPSRHWGLNLLFAPGVTFRMDPDPGLIFSSTRNHTAFRPELILQLESVRMVQPLTDRTLALGSTSAVDLGVAYVGDSLMGPTVEFTLAYHAWPAGGGFVRVGRTLGPNSETVSAMVGLQLDFSLSAALAVGGACLFAAGAGLKEYTESGGPCRHGDPCWEERREEEEGW